MPNVSKLCYVGFNTSDYQQWHPILFDILGLEERADSPEGEHHLRLDDQHHRIALIEGDSDGFAYAGWEVDSQADFAALYDKLKKNGVDVVLGSAEERQNRAVLELMKFPGPDGVPTEVCFGPVQDNRPFEPSTFKFAGYQTEDQGLGHVVFHHSDRKAAEDFYESNLGMLLSDYIFWDEAEASFFHCNRRHHSLALMNQCFGTAAGQFNHLMVEAKSLDDVGRAYERVEELGLPLIMTYGRHTNDKVISFYMVTPAGFGIEYGAGGIEIDDACWEPKVHNAPKIWGHNLVG